MTKYFCHETAVIDEGAQIGSGTKIWHFVHISSGAVIGNNVTLGQGAFIGNEVAIGEGCKLQNQVSVFDKVTLEPYVFCGPGVVFTNVYNPRAEVDRKSEYMPTLVQRGATLGANCTIICGLTLGQYCFIGAGAVLTTDVKPFALMVGSPARQIGWVTERGERLPFSLEGSGEYVCPQNGERYTLLGNSVSLIRE